MTWKNKYVVWYRKMESIFGDEVPHLSDKEIEDCVSNKDWIIIPILGERNKQDAKLAQRPNLYFELSKKDEILVGVTYDKIESVRRLREIISPFNEKYRTAILHRLVALDDNFRTRVFRKIKRKYWAESPEYEEVLSEQSNKMDLAKFVKLFEAVDRIFDERNRLEKGKKYQLAPAINLIDTSTKRDDMCFRETLTQIKPVYEIAINVKTEEEFKEENFQHQLETRDKRKEDFAKYIEELKEKLSKKLITPKQYRELMMSYNKSN